MDDLPWPRTPFHRVIRALREAAEAGPVHCRLCGRFVTADRKPPAYAIPTCHACLPPPEPLPVIPVKATIERG